MIDRVTMMINFIPIMILQMPKNQRNNYKIKTNSSHNHHLISSSGYKNVRIHDVKRRDGVSVASLLPGLIRKVSTAMRVMVVTRMKAMVVMITLEPMRSLQLWRYD